MSFINITSPSDPVQILEGADVQLATRLARHRKHPAMRLAAKLSEVGDQPPLFALTGAVLACGLVTGERRLAGAGGRMLASLLLATWIKGGIKHLVARTRPHMLLDEGHYEVKPLGPDEGPWNSFPSGHTAGSVAVARALAKVYPEARLPAYACATAIALIQIPRGAHYPLDVTAGALVGVAAEAMIDRLLRVALAPEMTPASASAEPLRLRPRGS